MSDGSAAELFTLRADNGFQVSVTNYGAIITSVLAPDRNGKLGEVTLAFNSLEEYLGGHPYYGAFVGRVANRISGGGFTVDGTRYTVAVRPNGVHLHGGTRGFDKQLYRATVSSEADSATVTFERTSPDGEEGYPGNVQVACALTVTSDATLRFEYRARTDAATPVNLTNHSYWNLAGTGTILDHELQLWCDALVETDALSVPTGRILPTAGTPFDFAQAKTIRRDFAAVAELPTRGYDHCLCVQGWQDGAVPELLPVAALRDPVSGRTMEVHSSCPGVQVYSGNNLVGQKGRDGSVLKGQEALCLETQFYPDSVNQPAFPSTILRPGQEFHHVTVHRFGVR